MRFATKLALIFSGFIVVAGSIVVYSVSVSTKDIMESAISDKLQEQAFHAMDKIDRAFYQRYYMAKILREELVEYFSEGKNPNTKDVAKLLAKFQSKHQVFTSLSFFDMDRLRLADSKGEDLGKIHSNS
ncbi:MAG: hypothetical protein HY280_00475, partial [Nitrospinae bacterium]|nr:hypothetical protein [Nitrospinota bacterium]